MSVKYVFLSVICSKQPCYLTIIADDCCVIKNKKIRNTASKFRIETKGNKLVFIVKYNYYTIFKTIYLNNCFCNDICINFTFNTKISQKTNNLIKLSDANYNFPIKNAILKFKNTI